MNIYFALLWFVFFNVYVWAQVCGCFFGLPFVSISRVLNTSDFSALVEKKRLHDFCVCITTLSLCILAILFILLLLIFFFLSRLGSALSPTMSGVAK